MSVEIWWLGQAGFRLRDPDGGPTIFVDPFLSDHLFRKNPPPITIEELAQEADLVLCSHGHQDHFDRESLRLAAAVPGARFAVGLPRPLVPEARELGLPEERVIGLQPGEPWDLPGALIHPVLACHGVNVADAYNFGEQISNGLVRYLGFVIELGDTRVYHAGDCIPYHGQAELVSTLGPNVALLPINGRDAYRESERNVVGNMDAREAARLASDLGVNLLIPMHWNLLSHNLGYPHHLVEHVISTYPSLNVLVLGEAGKVVYRPS